MSDFSEYGGVADDWERVFATSPQAELPGGLSALEQRRLTNDYREASSRKFTQTIENVLVENFVFGDNVPVRVYRLRESSRDVKLPVYLWYHGGGLLNGSLDAEDSHCYKVALELNVVVVHVCYRHTPEYLWPTQAEDAMAGLDWVFDNIDSLGGEVEKVIIGGRSAGTCLAVAAVLQDLEKHGKSRLCGQILDLPSLCHSSRFPNELIAPGKGSYEECQNGPGLTATRSEFYQSLAGEKAKTDRLYSPLIVEDEAWKGAPPTHFQIAGRDILRDHAFLFMQKLERVGTPTTFNAYKGVPHGFTRWKMLEASKQWAPDHFQAVRVLLGRSGEAYSETRSDMLPNSNRGISLFLV